MTIEEDEDTQIDGTMMDHYELWRSKHPFAHRRAAWDAALIKVAEEIKFKMARNSIVSDYAGHRARTEALADILGYVNRLRGSHM